MFRYSVFQCFCRWLSRQLREYDVRPRTMRFGESILRGYLLEDLRPAFRRYISGSDLEVFKAEGEVMGV